MKFPVLIVTAVLVAGIASGCGKFDSADRHLESMDQNLGRMTEQAQANQRQIDSLTANLERLARSLESIDSMANAAFKEFLQNLAPKAPAKTPDIDDIFGPGAMATPSPQPSPTDTSSGDLTS